jgi:hypothetical protein
MTGDGIGRADYELLPPLMEIVLSGIASSSTYPSWMCCEVIVLFSYSTPIQAPVAI